MILDVLKKTIAVAGYKLSAYEIKFTASSSNRIIFSLVFDQSKGQHQ
jgi:hypothetical protein